MLAIALSSLQSSSVFFSWLFLSERVKLPNPGNECLYHVHISHSPLQTSTRGYLHLVGHNEGTHIFKDEVSCTEVKDKFIPLFLRSTRNAFICVTSDQIYLLEFVWNCLLPQAFGAINWPALWFLFSICQKTKSISFFWRTSMCVIRLYCHCYHYGEVQLKLYHNPWLV